MPRLCSALNLPVNWPPARPRESLAEILRSVRAEPAQSPIRRPPRLARCALLDLQKTLAPLKERTKPGSSGSSKCSHHSAGRSGKQSERTVLLALDGQAGRAILVMSDRHSFGERAVNRAPGGDLRKSLPLFVIEVTAEEKLKVNAVDLALARVTRHTRLDPVERPALAFGVQPNREHRSGAERRQHCFRRRRARVLPTLVHGLVDQHAVRADPCFRLQIAEPGHLHRSCHVIPLC